MNRSTIHSTAMSASSFFGDLAPVLDAGELDIAEPARPQRQKKLDEARYPGSTVVSARPWAMEVPGERPGELATRRILCQGSFSPDRS